MGDDDINVDRRWPRYDHADVASSIVHHAHPNRNGARWCGTGIPGLQCRLLAAVTGLKDSGAVDHVLQPLAKVPPHGSGRLVPPVAGVTNECTKNGHQAGATDRPFHCVICQSSTGSFILDVPEVASASERIPKSAFLLWAPGSAAAFRCVARLLRTTWRCTAGWLVAFLRAAPGHSA